MGVGVGGDGCREKSRLQQIFKLLGFFFFFCLKASTDNEFHIEKFQ